MSRALSTSIVSPTITYSVCVVLWQEVAALLHVAALSLCSVNHPAASLALSCSRVNGQLFDACRGTWHIAVFCDSVLHCTGC